MTYLERLQALLDSLKQARLDATSARAYSLVGTITYEITRDLDVMIDKVSKDIRRVQQLEDKENQ